MNAVAEKINPSRISLETPALQFRDSYVECIKDMIAADPKRGVGFQWHWLENFDLYLDSCRKQAAQTDVVDGRAPAITYWIVIDKKQAVGKFTLHPVITPRLQVLGGHFGYEIRPAFRRMGIAEAACALGLSELKRLGFKNVFSTCDEDNIGSKRVLEKNGGKQVDRYELPDWPKPVLKFEFDLADRDAVEPETSLQFNLRPASSSDFDFLRQLHRLTLKPYVEQVWGWDEAQQEKLLRDRFDPEKLKIIQQNGNDIGLLQVELKPEETFLGNILLLPDVQGRGLGGKIVESVIGQANQAGQPVTLTVLKPNPAKKLYERLGFIVTSEDEVRFFMKREREARNANYTEFSDPRLVALYETLNPLGEDSEFFCAQAAKLGAKTIIDLGCGTGILTCELAKRGHQMTGIEPAKAMLAIARAKPNANQIKWINGSFEQLPGLKADMVLMTSHVSQFFLEDSTWRAMLQAAHGALNAGGHLVFDVRCLANPPFKGWPTEENRRRFENTAAGPVQWWFKLLGVENKRVRYELHYFFERTNEKIMSVNELVFRSQDEVTKDLSDAGFALEATYGNWDSSPISPGSPEMLFVARSR